MFGISSPYSPYFTIIFHAFGRASVVPSRSWKSPHDQTHHYYSLVQATWILWLEATFLWMKSVKSHLYVVVCFSDAWTNFWWNRCSAADPAPSSSEYQPGPTVAVRPPLSYQSRRWCGPDVSAHRRCPWPLGVNTGGTWKYLAMFLHGDYIYIYIYIYMEIAWTIHGWRWLSMVYIWLLMGAAALAIWLSMTRWHVGFLRLPGVLFSRWYNDGPCYSYSGCSILTSKIRDIWWYMIDMFH